MKKYEIIYSFKVIDEIKNGETVYMLDREKNEVKVANAMTASHLISLLETVGENKTRYEFWIVKED